MTADAELAVARAASPPPGAVLEVLQVPVLVLGPRGQLVSANAAARHLLGDELERAAEGVLHSLAREAWQGNRPVEQEIAAAADPALPAEETGRLSAQDVTLDIAAHTVWVRGERVELPFKEFAVLRLLLEQAGRVVPRQRLIECVWGRDFSGDPKTLDVHVKRLRAKIEVDRARPTRIVTVRQIGYRFERTG